MDGANRGRALRQLADAVSSRFAAECGRKTRIEIDGAEYCIYIREETDAKSFFFRKQLYRTVLNISLRTRTGAYDVVGIYCYSALIEHILKEEANRMDAKLQLAGITNLAIYQSGY